MKTRIAVAFLVFTTSLGWTRPIEQYDDNFQSVRIVGGQSMADAESTVSRHSRPTPVLRKSVSRMRTAMLWAQV